MAIQLRGRWYTTKGKGTGKQIGLRNLVFRQFAPKLSGELEIQSFNKPEAERHHPHRDFGRAAEGFQAV